MKKSMKNQLFPFYFLKTKPWNPSKKLDLAICYTGKNNSSVRFNLTDLVKKKVANLQEKTARQLAERPGSQLNGQAAC